MGTHLVCRRVPCVRLERLLARNVRGRVRAGGASLWRMAREPAASRIRLLVFTLPGRRDRNVLPDSWTAAAAAGRQRHHRGGPDRFCTVHIATLDDGLVGLARATGCSSSEVEALVLGELGEFVLAGQLQTNEIQGNDISLEVFGSNIESATSIFVRVVNPITVERDDSLVGTCLESAVAQLEEPEHLLGLQPAPTEYVAPTSVVNPPVITFPTITIPTVPS